MATKQEKLQKLTKLYEYLAKSEETPGFDPMAKDGQRGYMEHIPWKDEDSDQFIYNINKIKRVYRGPLSKHTYEFDTDTDRFRLSDDNRIWSTTMASQYRYQIGNLVDREESATSSDKPTHLNPNNQELLIITNKKHTIKNPKKLEDADIPNILGTISKSGDFTKNELYGQTPDEDKRPQWLRYTQTVADFVGVIPVIGDAIDIINAAVYFAYGKTIDGILSLISVIPIIGSAIALPIKGLLKAGGKLGNGLKMAFGIGSRTGDFAKGFEYLVKNGLLDPKHLPALEKGLAEIAANGKAAAKSGYLPDGLAKIVDDFVIALEKAGGRVGNIEAKTTFKSVEKALELSKAATKANFWRKFNPLKGDIFKKFSFWPDKQIARIADNLTNNFRVKMINNPSQLATMINTSSTKFANQGADAINKATRNYNPRMLPSNETDVLANRLKMLKNNMNPKDYELLADNLIRGSQNNGSLVWNMYKTNHLNNLKAYANLDGIWKNLQTQTPKWLDVISNEVQAAGVDLGAVDEQNKEVAVFYPLMAWGVNNKMPGVRDTMTAIKNNPMVQMGVAAAKGTMDYAAEAAGLSDSEAYDFDLKYDGEGI